MSRTIYPEAFLLPNKATPITEVTKHNCPGYVPFANEFSYFMDYSGQGYGFATSDGWRCDFNYTLADILTGHAMRPVCLTPTRDELFRVYRAAGFSPQVFTAAQMTEAEMKEAIQHALVTLGQPVILPVENRFFGSVVVGYKDNANVLVTYGFPPLFMDWNNTQPKIEDVANWYSAKTELTIVGTREKIVDAKDLYREGLRQIRAYLETGVRGNERHLSPEWENFLRMPLDEMLAEVKRTRTVPGADCGELQGLATDENARKLIDNIADPTWCNVAERRYYIMHFFNQAAQHFPEEAQAMHEIANHFWYASEIMGNLKTGYVSEVGHDPVNAEAFEKREVRNRMADCVRRFREADEKGLEIVETLLERMGFRRDVFETKNLILRRWRKTDAEDLRQYALYKNGTGFETWEKWPTEIGECEKCAAWFAGNPNGWAVERKADSRVIGFVVFNEVKDRLLDFGHAFTHPLVEDVALKTEALKIMVQYAFDVLAIDAVDARNEKAWTDNTAPLFALGFVELEDKMQMTREQWAAKK